MENKIQLFEGVKERYAWDAENEEWLFSAADVCNVLAESASKDPTAYWRKLKQRLLKEGSEVVTNCHELKMKASNGKLYQTDCFTTADTLRLHRFRSNDSLRLSARAEVLRRREALLPEMRVRISSPD